MPDANIHDLVDLPPLPIPQEEGLLWFVFEADAWDKTIGVSPNERLGVILVFKGESLEEATQAAAINRAGNFLDLSAPPAEAKVVLHHSEYKDQLAARLAERNRRN